ncbi:2TM domain-containing protein [Marinimicrobium sp. ARAG 43.8]|uniref:2TM domain-containing protein n=1 Tax=Marinimicrobium sp. ARAG 43.8 TaxID=3418719 RepID=UPI003CF9D3B2
MMVRKLRLQRGWSQDQLAQLSGLSVRTIQRIERGQKAGLESLKSLAAVFDVQVVDLEKEVAMTTDQECFDEERRVIEYVRDLKGFYSHLLIYIVVISGLFVFNFTVSPEFVWAKWVAFGWGVGVISHGLSVFEIFDFFMPNWERKQIEKRLGKKL